MVRIIGIPFLPLYAALIGVFNLSPSLPPSFRA